MYLIDADNLVKVPVTPYLQKEIKRVIDSGEVLDGWGDAHPYEDYVDDDGDICVDEQMYDDLIDKFFTR